MNQWKKLTAMNRRDFLKIGLVGTTSTVLGASVLADAVQVYAQEQAGAFRYPAPVYRTLGRTGLKVAVVGFGAMLTPEPSWTGSIAPIVIIVFSIL